MNDSFGVLRVCFSMGRYVTFLPYSSSQESFWDGPFFSVCFDCLSSAFLVCVRVFATFQAFENTMLQVKLSLLTVLLDYWVLFVLSVTPDF